MTRFALALTFSILTAASASAQITKPIRYTWMATSVASWKDAAAALVLADGDGTVLAMPTGEESHPWLLLRRVEEGSIFIPDDEPRICDVFPTMTEASSYYLGMDSCHAAMMVTVPDGRSLVVSMRNCTDDGARRRVVRR
ncbi:MAG TPA: hypothetical protein VFP80_15150 [Thermoanaerobaculia bacterium]|nr:hypothetical protein [Thermoanaerobaculia bacterium]